jgi:hypothetical protein
MTDHDQHAAIGELTQRYSDAKRKRVAVASEIGKCRYALASFASVLQKMEGFETYNRVTSDTVARLPNDYPHPDRVTELLNDLRAALAEIERTHKLLKDAGVDVA